MYECRLKRRNKNGMARSVLDTIPNSRLAQYGHYVYDEVRESCYTAGAESPRQDTAPNHTLDTSHISGEQEAWMSEEVDKIFNVMNDPNSR